MNDTIIDLKVSSDSSNYLKYILIGEFGILTQSGYLHIGNISCYLH